MTCTAVSADDGQTLGCCYAAVAEFISQIRLRPCKACAKVRAGEPDPPSPRSSLRRNPELTPRHRLFGDNKQHARPSSTRYRVGWKNQWSLAPAICAGKHDQRVSPALSPDSCFAARTQKSWPWLSVVRRSTTLDTRSAPRARHGSDSLRGRRPSPASATTRRSHCLGKR